LESKPTYIHNFQNTKDIGNINKYGMIGKGCGALERNLSEQIIKKALAGPMATPSTSG
jgi:hypothetical protein